MHSILILLLHFAVHVVDSGRAKRGSFTYDGPWLRFAEEMTIVWLLSIQPSIDSFKSQSKSCRLLIFETFQIWPDVGVSLCRCVAVSLSIGIIWPLLSRLFPVDGVTSWLDIVSHSQAISIAAHSLAQPNWIHVTRRCCHIDRRCVRYRPSFVIR